MQKAAAWVHFVLAMRDNVFDFATDLRPARKRPAGSLCGLVWPLRALLYGRTPSQIGRAPRTGFQISMKGVRVRLRKEPVFKDEGLGLGT
eukprot:822241-Rhodomonas_salina.4